MSSPIIHIGLELTALGLATLLYLLCHRHWEALADWWSQVERCFDGPAPDVEPVNVSCDEVTLVALHFNTDQPPYVVKNPAGGPIGFEVPWRSATSIRSARREDLLKLLVPMLSLPKVETLEAHLQLKKITGIPDDSLEWGTSLFLKFYVTPDSDKRFVLPDHCCKCNVIFPSPIGTRTVNLSLSPETGDYIEMPEPGQNGSGDLRTLESQTIVIGPTEIIFKGPGTILAHAFLHFPYVSPHPKGQEVNVCVTMRPAGSDRSVLIQEIMLPLDHGESESDFRWNLKSTSG